MIENGDKLPRKDRGFLSSALLEISNGGDADTALGVKANRGERTGAHTRDTKIRRQHMYGWLATAIAPEREGGLGMTLKDAVETFKSTVEGLPSEESLRRYWNEVKDTQEREYKLETD